MEQLSNNKSPIREIDFRWLIVDGERELQFRTARWVPGDKIEWGEWSKVKEVHR
jgi:hypothetical protein